jgi:hypothetical protein
MRIQEKKKAIEEFLLEHRRAMSREWMALPRKERTDYPHETWRNFLEENGIERVSQYWGYREIAPPAEYDYKRSMEEGYWGFGGKKWLLQDGTPAATRKHIIVNDPVWYDWATSGARKNDFFSQGQIELARWWGLRIPKEFALKILVLKFI